MRRTLLYLCAWTTATMLGLLGYPAGAATDPPRLGQVYVADPHPPADKATVYVYREYSAAGSRIELLIKAHDIPLSNLLTGSYIVYRTAPGDVELTAATEAKTSVRFEALAGEVYYVKASLDLGVFIGRPHLELVSREVAEPDLAQCRLVLESTESFHESRDQLQVVTVPNDEGAVATFGVQWFAGINILASAKTVMQSGQHLVNGAIMLTDRSLTLLVGADVGSRTGTGLHIPYTDIASIELTHYGMNRAVLITHRDAHVDSFQIVRGVLVDRDKTMEAYEALRAKVDAALPAGGSR